jgi:hypothetical protein
MRVPCYTRYTLSNGFPGFGFVQRSKKRSAGLETCTTSCEEWRSQFALTPTLSRGERGEEERDRGLFELDAQIVCLGFDLFFL